MVFCFLDLVFLRKKRTGLVYIDVLLHRVIGKKETLNKNMILMFLECFYDNTLNHFYVNIVVILFRGREFFSAECVHFSLTLTERNRTFFLRGC